MVGGPGLRMIYNKDLQRLFEIMHLDPETVFKGGLGVYDQQQAEAFIEQLKTDAFNEGYDSAQAGVQDEIGEAIEEKECEVKEDIDHYVRYNLQNDYKKCIENEDIDTSADDFTEEKMFEIITDLICENI